MSILYTDEALAVNNREEIYGVDGIDGIFVGPSDLAASMGHLADSGHPDVKYTFAEITKRCHRIAAPVCILSGNEADARKYIDMGFNFVGVGSDSGLLKTISRELAQSFKSE